MIGCLTETTTCVVAKPLVTLKEPNSLGSLQPTFRWKREGQSES